MRDITHTHTHAENYAFFHRQMNVFPPSASALDRIVGAEKFFLSLCARGVIRQGDEIKWPNARSHGTGTNSVFIYFLSHLLMVIEQGARSIPSG